MEGPILKDAAYFGFWAVALGVGVLFGTAIVYLLWEILQALRDK